MVAALHLIGRIPRRTLGYEKPSKKKSFHFVKDSPARKQAHRPLNREELQTASTAMRPFLAKNPSTQSTDTSRSSRSVVISKSGFSGAS